MKQQEVLKKIGVIIQELSDQFEYLEAMPGDLNVLELELFVANANFLTDHIEILSKLNLQNRIANRPVDKQEASYEQKYFEPMVQQLQHGLGLTDPKTVVQAVKVEEPQNIKVVAEIAPEPVGTKVSQIVPQPVPVYAPPVVDEAVEVYTAPHVPKPVITPVVLNENENLISVTPKVNIETALMMENSEIVHHSVPDLPVPGVEVIPGREPIRNFAAEQPAAFLEEKQTDKPVQEMVMAKESEVLSINQKISTLQRDKTPSKGEQISVKPINDLKLAITLNDKLLFVKDLFNGYNLAYSEAIEILNRFTTFEEASRFLNSNYVIKNDWESKAATTEKFYALLRRRYS